jgi:hypothetical protein
MTSDGSSTLANGAEHIVDMSDPVQAKEDVPRQPSSPWLARVKTVVEPSFSSSNLFTLPSLSNTSCRLEVSKPTGG